MLITTYEQNKSVPLKCWKGPSFLKALPTENDWQLFLDAINSKQAQTISALWYSKAHELNGIPLRKDFSFRDLVVFGKNLYIGKLDGAGNWITTFCGEEVAQKSGQELTNKSLDEFADQKTLKFWQDNLKTMTVEHCPFIEFYTLEYADKDFINCLAVNLPLRTGNTEFPDMFMAYEIYSCDSLLP